jgi:predicted phosphodiesterase
MRVVLISDTHDHHGGMTIPDGDVIIHAGDSTSHGRVNELQQFAAFWRALPHPHKIVIAGNHDFGLQTDPTLGKTLFGESYLCDSETTVGGLRVWGSPWQPWFHGWAFNLQRGPEIRAKWDLIPSGIDILVTHGPPYEVRDSTDHGLFGRNVGCEELRISLDRVRPRLHVFGHIHEAYGTAWCGPTLCVNASSCAIVQNGRFAVHRASNAPIVVDVPEDRSLPATLV